MKAGEVIALIGGHVTKEVLLRNEYLAAEERVRLATIGQRLGKKALAEVGAIFKPEFRLVSYFGLVEAPLTPMDQYRVRHCHQLLIFTKGP